jgi:NAD(P)-dependent dehydrogenase (short-subunit alcohol dehydrogenase family)
MDKKVWYITGASKGLGLALIKKLLKEGHQVAATSRTLPALVEAVGKDHPDFLPLEVDLSSEPSVAASISAANDRFGRIDVVVNNAGYGIGGTIEELSMEEIRQNFEVNVFGTILVIQKVMPYLRAQGSGHIINIASIAGFAGATGWAVYAAAKQAVIGLSDVLAQDTRTMGIHVTAVAPGAFRTQFLSKDSLALSRNRIEDYKDVRAAHARYLSIDGKQPGDPVKAAAALLQIAASPEPPTLLFLGSDAYCRATAKMTELSEQIEQWKTLSMSTQLAD